MITEKGYQPAGEGLRGKIIDRLVIPGMVALRLLKPVEFQIDEPESPEEPERLEDSELYQDIEEEKERLNKIEKEYLERVVADWQENCIIS